MSKKEEFQETEAPKKQLFLITPELLQGIGSYLGTKPYKEVSGLIEGLKQARSVSVEPEAPQDGKLAGELNKKEK